MDLNALIEQAYNLEPLPASAARLAGLVADPDSTLASITEVIRLDPSLTARVLRGANSARSAVRDPITTAHDAVIRLGRGTILSIAIGGAARKHLQRAIPAYGLGENVLWRHCVSAALAAESIGPFCKKAIPPEAFAAALLHDIGKLVLGRFLDAQTLSLLAQAQAEGHLNPLQAESEILEVNHAELGGLIAQKWELPETIVQGITYHHQPEMGDAMICDIVCISNELAVATGLAKMPSSLIHEDHTDSFARLGIAPQDQARVCDVVKTRFAQVLERFGA
jgi:putative nucleotidyltransferase with HDIG domain